jgi:hypothetical protein
MSGRYASEHAGGLADLAAAGARITFTVDDPGTEDANGRFTGAGKTTVSGYATDADGGDSKTYEALKLTESEAPRLLVFLDTYGDDVPMGSVATFGAVSGTVRDVKPYRPDGVTLFSYVIVQR